jgi:hypothetical protein
VAGVPLTWMVRIQNGTERAFRRCLRCLEQER